MLLTVLIHACIVDSISRQPVLLPWPIDFLVIHFLRKLTRERVLGSEEIVLQEVFMVTEEVLRTGRHIDQSFLTSHALSHDVLSRRRTGCSPHNSGAGYQYLIMWSLEKCDQIY